MHTAGPTTQKHDFAQQYMHGTFKQGRGHDPHLCHWIHCVKLSL